MRAKDVVIVVLMALLAVLSAYFWIRNVQLRDRQMKQAKAHLNMNVSLYLTLQVGDVDKVQRSLGVIILGQTREFERIYGVPSGTNRFAKQFRRAQTIAAQIETNMVPLTSIFPDAEMTVMPTE